MNVLMVVIPVLMLLMLGLGLELRLGDFARVLKKPKAAILGLSAQLLGLPLVALAVASLLGLEPVLAVGLVLLAACPGGASSNAFTMLARGDVALSVSLTAVTSVVTVATIPLVVNLAMVHFMGTGAELRLALGPVLGQNAVTILLPIATGMLLRARAPVFADKLGALLRRATVPLLLLMIAVFAAHQREVLLEGARVLTLATFCLICGTMALGAALGRIGRLAAPARSAIQIEVGMQNAAQAIAIAASPFLLANAAYAVPAIVYAVVMNIVLLAYVGWVRSRAPIPGEAAKGSAMGEAA